MVQQLIHHPLSEQKTCDLIDGLSDGKLRHPAYFIIQTSGASIFG